jgi:hypothetical protein
VIFDRWPGWGQSAPDATEQAKWSGQNPGQPLLLPPAIRQASRPSQTLREGYRVEVYRDAETDSRMPVLTAAVDADKLFPVFLDLLSPLGNIVDFIVESSHDLLPETSGSPMPLTWERTSIDLPVLTSLLYDYEDMLVNDGCTGVAVLNPNRQFEVHFDEHKLIYIYGQNLSPFKSVLRDHNIPRNDDLILLIEEEHIHCTLDEYLDQLNELRQAIGVEGEVESAPW